MKFHLRLVLDFLCHECDTSRRTGSGHELMKPCCKWAVCVQSATIEIGCMG